MHFCSYGDICCLETNGETAFDHYAGRLLLYGENQNFVFQKMCPKVKETVACYLGSLTLSYAIGLIPFERIIKQGRTELEEINSVDFLKLKGSS